MENGCFISVLLLLVSISILQISGASVSNTLSTMQHQHKYYHCTIKEHKDHCCTGFRKYMWSPLAVSTSRIMRLSAVTLDPLLTKYKSTCLPMLYLYQEAVLQSWGGLTVPDGLGGEKQLY